MNGMTTTHDVPKIYLDAANEGDNTAAQLRTALLEYEIAYEDERNAYRTKQQAQTDLDAVLNEVVMRAELEARELKEGPLANLAKTSKSYDAALAKLKADATAQGGEAYGEQRTYDTCESLYREAEIRAHNAKLRWQTQQALLGYQTARMSALSATYR